MSQGLKLDREKLIAALRNQEGIFLAEMLVAVLVSSILAAALIGNISETYRLSSAGQNQVLASAIAQEVIDNTRNTQYDTLDGYKAGSPFTLIVHKKSSSDVFPAIYPRPLLMNTVDMVWTSPALDNMWEPTVTESVADGPVVGETLRVTVTVVWVENGLSRNYTMSTIVSRGGIHN
jgi:type II secretory pathway pseudopilin PulG